jgi:hypothetical protein
MTDRSSRSRGLRSSIFVLFSTGGASGGAGSGGTGKTASVEVKGIDWW